MVVQKQMGMPNEIARKGKNHLGIAQVAVIIEEAVIISGRSCTSWTNRSQDGWRELGQNGVDLSSILCQDRFHGMPREFSGAALTETQQVIADSMQSSIIQSVH
jgi:hypothetical protein